MIINFQNYHHDSSINTGGKNLAPEHTSKSAGEITSAALVIEIKTDLGSFDLGLNFICFRMHALWPVVFYPLLGIILSASGTAHTTSLGCRLNASTLEKSMMQKVKVMCPIHKHFDGVSQVLKGSWSCCKLEIPFNISQLAKLPFIPNIAILTQIHVCEISPCMEFPRWQEPFIQNNFWVSNSKSKQILPPYLLWPCSGAWSAHLHVLSLLFNGFCFSMHPHTPIVICPLCWIIWLTSWIKTKYITMKKLYSYTKY